MSKAAKTTGTIGVTTDNIFPVIKKFLYSDHEIFLRELVSNAVDATQKLKTLSSKGEIQGELGDLAVRITLDKKTLTVSDRGIGMTAEEIEKYINQIAFSGATDFLEKYKDNANAIIGHFGLGFYSAFMVADKVEIITKSYKDAPAVKWSCDGSPEFTMEETKKEDRGTDIVLHISDDCKEYLEKYQIESLLGKYCKFMPVPVIFGKETEWKDGKSVETDKDHIINSTDPIWTKAPSELKDEDYTNFYKALYPMSDEPLFWIHLNVDFPFHLTGILYFPKIKSNLELQKNKIQLYCNQVYVTDSVEGIVPDFLTLLHGVIDSPDIPLNVSRSYLQSDANVKKISGYITKKVADRLTSIFKTDRASFESKWDDLKVFMDYGMLTEEEFYSKIESIALFKDTDAKYYTFKEYRTLIEPEQTDKDGNVIYLYANNLQEQYSFIEIAKAKGYNVLLMDNPLDVALIGMLEQKIEKCRFNRVDADSIDKLIAKEDKKETGLSEDASALLSKVFQNAMPALDKIKFTVEVNAQGADALPVMITQSEYMRRMKEMSNIQAGMAFYGQMDDMLTVLVNSDHPVTKRILEEAQAAIQGDDAKDDAKVKAWGQNVKVLNELVDLALLQNGLLKGQALSNFIHRSVDLL
ncbi:MAG: molecular chaperone HtpG [Bacteroidaceae bacterium]|nr:molecular chaperone HtpG [Bacteroidaceae bacterium]